MRAAITEGDLLEPEIVYYDFRSCDIVRQAGGAGVRPATDSRIDVCTRVCYDCMVGIPVLELDADTLNLVEENKEVEVKAW